MTVCTGYDPTRHHRHSLRLQGYDYAQAGAYFVTICTEGRRALFGEIGDGAMRLNDLGKTVAECWESLPRRYAHVELDEYVVLPNHLHGIIVLGRGDEGGSRTAPTGGAKRKPLGRLIGAFKTESAHRINDLRSTPGAPLWQRNYFEHVIRDDVSLSRIRQYIVGNPTRWDLDPENPYKGR